MAVVHSESERRVRRIRALAIQLEEQTVLNTARSRARCRDVAREILNLIDAEDQFEENSPAEQPQDDPEVLRRITQTLRTCRAADERAELSRLYSMTHSRNLDVNEARDCSSIAEVK